MIIVEYVAGNTSVHEEKDGKKFLSYFKEVESKVRELDSRGFTLKAIESVKGSDGYAEAMLFFENKK